jgi:nitrile hydratase subunit beta
MDGIHDLGGMHGFGPVPIQSENYVFKHEWQRRSFGLAQALAGPTPFCADMHRHKIEQLPAIEYLRRDYFEMWAIATSELLKDAGLVSATELVTGTKEFDVDLTKHAPTSAEALLEAMMLGAKLDFPATTRVPRYVRGKVGKIIADMGVFQFADTMAHGLGPRPQHCYTVVFTVEALWGKGAERAGDAVYLDLAEAYLAHL